MRPAIVVVIAVIAVIAVVTGVVTGCRPPGFEIGGGGSTHLPPAFIVQAEPTTLNLELSVWGEGSGRMSKRWQQVKCHYRVAGTDAYATIDMVPSSEQPRRIVFTCTIPPQAKAGAEMEYYFDMLFDGHHNTRDGGKVPIRPAADSTRPASIQPRPIDYLPPAPTSPQAQTRQAPQSVATQSAPLPAPASLTAPRTQ